MQEYAEGKTVAKSLSDRLKSNRTFKEAEAVEFLQNMLPVLSHIHNMGIIHRDISPDNIIFRDRDKLPVLIDFGVVKAGVTQLEVSTQIHQGTTVGKAGYAPGEQLQTGEAYANSDLYALAVTVVVMMTGRKPESLIDKSTMTWKWHQWVPTLTPWFAKILNRMLSRAPNSRYQSATEVAQALRSVSDFVGTAPATGLTGNLGAASGTLQPPTGYGTPSSTQNGSSVPLSRVKRSTNIKSSSYSPVKRPHQNPLRGILNTPWGTALGAGVAGLGFILLLFAISRSLTTNGNSTKTPPPVITPTTDPIQPPTDLSTPEPAPINSPEPAPTPIATAPPTPAAAESLVVEIDKPIVKEGILNPNQPTVFRLNPAVGQQLRTTLTSTPPGATMNILAPNQANVDVFAKNTVNWQGVLPLAGEYRIEIVSPAGAVSSNYKLDVSISAPAPVTPTTPTTPGTTPTPTPAPR